MYFILTVVFSLYSNFILSSQGADIIFAINGNYDLNKSNFALSKLILLLNKFAEIQRDFNTQIVEALEHFKQEMPCGVPSLGIPPLSPLLVAQQDINLHIAGLEVTGEVSDFRLDGLNDFTIEQLRVNILKSQISFKFNWSRINFTTDYVLSTNIGGIESSGVAKFGLENFTAQGDISYSLQFLTGTFKVNKFNLYLNVNDVRSDIDGLSEKHYLNSKLNEFIEEWILMAINDSSEKIVKLSNEFVLPVVNQALTAFTLNDLFNSLSSNSEACSLYQ